MPDHAHAVQVDDHEPLIGGETYDYADAFEIVLPDSDHRSAEELGRCGLEEAPAAVREAIWTAHHHLLRLRLGPRTSPDHVLGWEIMTSQPDVVQLEATS